MPELRLENSLVDERYEVRERLGLGSYAEIWVAYDHFADGRAVVLKALNTSLQGTPDADLERTLVENFQNEAIALDTVRHPHVILRLGHGTAADLRGTPFHYLVLEYLPGGDLLRLSRQQPGNRLSLDKALFYFKQACEALAYAHSQGIIHRDVKPNNLLTSADHRTLKVADFGVAKLTTGEEAEITRVGAGLYAPPEHHPDELTGRVERLTAAADVYSLAKSVYTVVCGRAPSQFACQTITALPADIRGEAWAAGLLNVLQHATALDPKDRYATVVEFWGELANVAILAQEEEAETQVRPRLNVSQFDVPTTPAQPEFNPVLASSGSQAAAVSVAAAVAQVETVPPVMIGQPVVNRIGQPPLAKPVDHAAKPKIVVDLKPAPARPAPPAAAPPQNGKVFKPRLAKPASAATFSARALRLLFTGFFGRLLFRGLLAIALLVCLRMGFHYVRDNGLPLPVGTPSQIEVVTDNLNVRGGPSMQEEYLGQVARGTRHRVLAGNEQGWMKIEVKEWNDAQPHVSDQKQGWINGHPRFVKVVGRRWW
jgi:serine/threonine protein kinase